MLGLAVAADRSLVVTISPGQTMKSSPLSHPDRESPESPMLQPNRFTMPSNRFTLDLAGYCLTDPSYLQTRARINYLINRYLSIDILSEKLADLPRQFVTPHVRPWEPIDWAAIDSDQIVGIDPHLFTLVLSGAMEIEAPVRGYSQESWHYLQSLHPDMAHFFGGDRQVDGSFKTLGVWEKEERQHAPIFGKLYHKLTGEKFQPKPNSVEEYQAQEQPWEAVRRHWMSRISTEWAATSIYLWLMAHSTGALQQAIAQPLQDEVNHLAKFWGFSRWAFASSYHQQVQGSALNLLTLVKHHQTERTHGDDLLHYRLDEVSHSIELAFSLMRVMVRLRRWNGELSSSFLRHLLGDRPTFS